MRVEDAARVARRDADVAAFSTWIDTTASISRRGDRVAFSPRIEDATRVAWRRADVSAPAPCVDDTSLRCPEVGEGAEPLHEAKGDPARHRMGGRSDGHLKDEDDREG